MRHLIYIAAFGLLTAAVPGTQAQAADPSGYWLNDVGSAKMEVKKCGKGLCAKIIWLREPNDSRGKPLHDARNENSQMRDRPILGLPLFSNMAPAGPNVWVGNVYNPEEGRVYTEVKITLASSRQIVLRGCKAWLLCGEKSWSKTTFTPKPEPDAVPGEEQVEAKADTKPDKPKAELVAPAEETAKAGPAQIPAPAVRELQANAGGEAIVTDAMPRAQPARVEALKPELPSPSHDASVGFGFVTTSAAPTVAPPFSSQNVSSMFAITEPISMQATPGPGLIDQAAADPAESGSTPLPAQKPKAAAKPVASTEPESEPSAPAAAKPKPQATAEASNTPAPAAAPKPKTRSVVRKDRDELPWLQHP